MSIHNKSQNSLRRERNAELLRRMRNGDSLTSYDSAASWFPPRPIIEKDEKAMQQLYGSKRRINEKTVQVKFTDVNAVQNQGEEERSSTIVLLPKAN